MASLFSSLRIFACLVLVAFSSAANKVFSEVKAKKPVASKLDGTKSATPPPHPPPPSRLVHNDGPTSTSSSSRGFFDNERRLTSFSTSLPGKSSLLLNIAHALGDKEAMHRLNFAGTRRSLQEGGGNVYDQAAHSPIIGNPPKLDYQLGWSSSTISNGDGKSTFASGAIKLPNGGTGYVKIGVVRDGAVQDDSIRDISLDDDIVSENGLYAAASVSLAIAPFDSSHTLLAVGANPEISHDDDAATGGIVNVYDLDASDPDTPIFSYSDESGIQTKGGLKHTDTGFGFSSTMTTTSANNGEMKGETFLLVGAPFDGSFAYDKNIGAVTLFQLAFDANNNNQVSIASLTKATPHPPLPNVFFGYSTAMVTSPRLSIIAVGGPGEFFGFTEFVETLGSIVPGFVNVYLSNTATPSLGAAPIEITDNTFSGFGHSLALSFDQKGRGVLAVGAPYYNYEFPPISRRLQPNVLGIFVGAVFLYSIDSPNVNPIGIMLPPPPFSNAFGFFGFSVALQSGTNTLVVGAPCDFYSGIHCDGAAFSYIFDVDGNTINNGDSNVPLQAFKANEGGEVGLFGGSVSVSDGGLLEIGEPFVDKLGQTNLFQGKASPSGGNVASEGSSKRSIGKIPASGLIAISASAGVLVFAIGGFIAHSYRSKKWSKLPLQQQQEEGVALTNKV